MAAAASAPLAGAELSTVRGVSPGAEAGATAAQADTLLLAAARRIAEAAPALAQLWPGFWPVNQSYVLTVPNKRVLLISATPPGEFVAVPDSLTPPALRGRAFVFEGPHPRLASSRGGFPYDLDFMVGESVAPAVAVRGGVAEAYEVLFHEGFHSFQSAHFPKRSVRESDVDEAALSDPRYEILAQVERRILIDALGAGDANALRDILRSYIAVRAERTRSVPQLVANWERELEVAEGTAEYVGYAATAVLQQKPGLVSERILSILSSELPAPPAGNRFYWRHRARVYGTGAAIGLLLDRVGADWQTAVQEGAFFDDLAANAAGPGETSIDVGAVLKRYGHQPQ